MIRALLVAGLLNCADGIEDPRSWPNVLESTSWLFDQGSQFGYRAEPSNMYASKIDSVAGCAIDAEGRLPFQQQDTDFIGNNLRNAPTPTLQACCELCRSTAGCVAYSWNAATDKWCNAKFGTPNATHKVGEIAGRITAPVQPIEHAIRGPSPDWALGGVDTPQVSYRLLQSDQLDPAASSTATLYPGRLVLNTTMPGLGTAGAEVSATLAFAGANTSANTTLVRFAARNIAPASTGRTHRSQTLDNVTFVIYGRAAGTSTAAAASILAPASALTGVDFTLPAVTSSEQSCFNVSEFKAGGLRVRTGSASSTKLTSAGTGNATDSGWVTTVTSDGTGIFELRSAPFSLLPGEERVVWVALTTGVAAQVNREASRALHAPEALFEATVDRWAAYLTRALPPAISAGTATPLQVQEADNIRWSSVKAVMTLMGNWRRVPGSDTIGNVLPSYVGYDRGAWSWDSYKQAVGMVRFAPQLAKDQLRVLAAARDRATGHIPDLTDRCGNGEGAAGKPPLLSWAVWEIYNVTGDGDFVAEMYPVIEGFHRFYYRHRDTKGVALCSWTEGMESGMDNGARFINSRTVSNASTGVSTLDFWSVDLNSFLYREKLVLSDMAELLGNASAAEAWRMDAAQLLPRLQRTFFVAGSGSSDGHYASSFFQDRYFNGTSVAVQGCEGYAALFGHIASEKQADNVARTLLDPATFWLNFSLPTLSKANPAFQPKTGYWRGPTWLDQSWFAARGLDQYGHTDMAVEIKRRIFARGQGMQVNDTTPFSENYDPDDGTALGAPQFSWSAAHVLMWAADM